MRIILICCVLAVCCAGCSTTHVYQISATPSDATLRLDGDEVGTGKAIVPITFAPSGPPHTITADRPGFQEASFVVNEKNRDQALHLDLKPAARRFSFTVQPVGALIKINSIPIGADYVSQSTTDLTFKLDDHNALMPVIVTAERAGFNTAMISVGWDSPRDQTLTMLPAKRLVSIDTHPSGAQLYLDDLSHEIGTAPTSVQIGFDFDASSGAWLPHRLIAQKAGWEPTTQPMTFEDSSTDYHFDLVSKSKVFRVTTNPGGGSVMVGGRELPRDSQGASYGMLKFVPVNERGDLPTYTAVASKKTPDTEWESTNVPVAWDNGKRDYAVKLKEITTRPVDTLSVAIERTGDGNWELTPKASITIAKKSAAEGNAMPPVSIYQAPDGQTIDTLAISPDGGQVLFTLLMGHNAADFHSIIMAKRSDGSGELVQISDGNSLDVMPSYTPNGDQIVFSSNRAGRTFGIWERSVQGIGGVMALAGNRDEQELWPNLDADPRTHLFYEALFDGQPVGHLFMATLNTTIRAELTQQGMSEPRVSPRADSVAFVSKNDKTGKREIYRMPITGGPPELLAGSLDSDNYDPAWSRDGSRLAFVSDRGVDDDRHNNPDIWVLDLSKTAEPVQVTSNGSVDDCPAWDPSGSAIYFRSNRGGTWGIWKIAVKGP